MRIHVLLVMGVCAACDGTILGSNTGPGGSGGGSSSTGGNGNGSGGSGGGSGLLCDLPPDDGGVTTDVLTPHRLLRRASLALKGVPPSDAEYAALDALGDSNAQYAYVSSFVDGVLQSPAYYESMFEFARGWFNMPLTPSTADAPEYGIQQQRLLWPCEATTANAGKWAYFREDYLPGGRAAACSGVLLDGGAAPQLAIEPWWAPGTTITLIGTAANTIATGTGFGGAPVNCNLGRPEGTCGCGPNAVTCHAHDTYPNFYEYLYFNPLGQRRQFSEEAARLFAHLAWYDRPATDLVLGTKMVGTTKTIASYVMQGVEGGDVSMLTDDSWWKPSKYIAAPADPLHTAGDPEAWREFDVPTVSPVFIADRNYKFDPRIQTGRMAGMPAAGMLTSLGFLASQPRERLRAARMLETLACEVLAPPGGGQTFNEYHTDPASEGPCQHCHRRIDPAAIHFKRFAKQGIGLDGWGAEYLMPGIAKWVFAPSWRSNPSDPYTHFKRWYTADKMMTPVSQARIDADPMSIFIDFLPPEQTLLNQVSDGTVGPLGFGKMIVAAGSFDRCIVRRVHGYVMGRDIDPAKEAGYLDKLTQDFVGGGRKVRPFVRQLTQSDLFRRGF